MRGVATPVSFSQAGRAAVKRKTQTRNAILLEVFMADAAVSSGKAVCLVGPTGSGKTAAALALAGRWPVGVINADSRQVYRDFPIITAQPAEDERRACPHLLYGYLDCAAKTSAGQWAARAAACMDEVAGQGRLPVFSGGTGLYLRALFDGMAEIPAVVPEIAADLEREALAPGGLERLYLRLRVVDPAYAGRIHPNDRQRVVRALEVSEGTGKPLSWWHAHPEGAESGRRKGASTRPDTERAVLRVGMNVPRPLLLTRLAARIEAMIAAGALEEAQRVRELCPDRSAPGWSGIGCAELFSFLEGEISFDECKELWLRNTAAYAKRQMTWFRADKRIRWVAHDDRAGLLKLAEDFLHN